MASSRDHSDAVVVIARERPRVARASCRDGIINAGDQDRYEKRASSKTSTKCFCGAKKCRGFLGDRAEDFLASLEEEETDAGRRFFRRKLRPDQAVDPASGKLVRSAFGEAEAEAVEIDQVEDDS